MKAFPLRDTIVLDAHPVRFPHVLNIDFESIRVSTTTTPVCTHPVYIMHLNQCEVWLTCEGQRLPEYSTVMESEKTVACYVPSEADKVGVPIDVEFLETCMPSDVLQKFVVHAKNDHEQFVSLQLEFDGVSSTCLAVNPGQTREKWGVRTGPTTRQPFKFSKLIVTGVSSTHCRA